uniref:Unclassified n=1 Tax=Fusarium pseudograminearum CS5834 TaxID=1318459 RepID=W1I9S6_FUSPS|nr:unclassified [Fusarium pseudograminearum CS5834]CDX48290.1 unclassified [Fusarium pseudograminearum CS5834]
MLYFIFTICENVFRAFDTSIADLRNFAGRRKAAGYSNNSKD